MAVCNAGENSLKVLIANLETLLVRFEVITDFIIDRNQLFYGISVGFNCSLTQKNTLNVKSVIVAYFCVTLSI